MRNQTITLFALILILSLIFFNAPTNAQLRCEIDQLTSNDEQESDSNAINADGTIVAFISEDNLTGQNPDNNNELFYYDISSRQFTQVTNTPSGNNRTPSLSGDGNLITYDFDESGEAQVFLFNRATGTTTQITNLPGKSEDPYVDILGNNITFSSDTNIVGMNPGLTEQVFQYNINTGVTSQRTDITVNFIQTTPTNLNGSLVIFSAFGNILGTNPDNNSEIYLINEVDTLTQLTFGQSGVDSRAEKFGVDSTANLITFLARGNPDGSTGPMGTDQVYIYNVSQNVFTKLTNDTSLTNNDPAINAEGTCVVFSSEEDLTGQNPMNYPQLFKYDIPTGTYTQIGLNRVDQGIVQPTPSGDCTKIAFYTRGNFNSPQDFDEEQVYLATCSIPQVPTLSEWGLIALAAVLGIFGFIVARRRQATA